MFTINVLNIILTSDTLTTRPFELHISALLSVVVYLENIEKVYLLFISTRHHNFTDVSKEFGNLIHQWINSFERCLKRIQTQ